MMTETQYKEIEFLSNVFALVKEHNISKLEYGNIKLENTRPDPVVLKNIENLTKPISDEELLRNPYIGL